MGLCDRWVVACLYCFIFSSIDCGRLSEYLFLQRQLLHLLRARQLTHQDFRPPPGVTMPHYDVISNHTDSTHWWRYGPTVSKGYVLKSARTSVSKKTSQPVIYSDILLNNTPYVHTNKYYNNVDSSVEKRRGTLSRIDAHIEILLVIDYSIYFKYLHASYYDEEAAKRNIIKYYGILLAMANERYSTISDASIKVQLSICDIRIAERRRHVAWLEAITRPRGRNGTMMVNASRALKRFQMWLRRNRSLPNYDHAIIFTNYILMSNNKRQQVDGLAYIGTMCKVSRGKSASIIQDAGDFQAAGVVAHELGHSLGATHDGDTNNKDCAAGLNHVMAPQNSIEARLTANDFYFSPCSIKQMKTFLMSDRSRCLRNAPVKGFMHSLEADPPGLLFNPDAQCAKAFGTDSTFCDQRTTQSVICARLWCLTPANPLQCRSSNRLMALPGTPCGYGKHCHLGQCVNDAEARSEPRQRIYYTKIKVRGENCPKGDRKPKQCSKIRNAYPELCHRRKYRERCCETCSGSRHLLKRQMTFVT